MDTLAHFPFLEILLPLGFQDSAFLFCLWLKLHLPRRPFFQEPVLEGSACLVLRPPPFLTADSPGGDLIFPRDQPCANDSRMNLEPLLLSGAVDLGSSCFFDTLCKHLSGKSIQCVCRRKPVSLCTPIQTCVPLHMLLISVNGSTIYLELGPNSLGSTTLQLSKYSPVSVLEQRLLPYSSDLGLVHRSYFEQRNGRSSQRLQ